MLVHQLLERASDRAPDAELVVDPTGRYTYGAVEAEANRIAHVLAAAGVRAGDRVALLAHNSHLYVESYYGILKAGGVAVPLNTASDPAMLEHFLVDSGARVLVAGPRMERLVHKAAARLGPVEVVVSPNPDKLRAVACDRVAYDTPASTDRPALALTGDDVASIIYTSGSTGRPRGATLTHAAIVANVEDIVAYLELSPDDRALQVLPLYYVYGKSVLNTHVCVGASIVIENRFQYPNVALDTLEAEACTGLSGVPSTFAILLNRSNFAARSFPHLRYVTQAGGGMSPALIERLMAAVDARVFIMYGATEASARLAYLPPDELPDAIGSVGYPIARVTLRVLRADGSECDVDEVGELVAAGPNIMRGYWNDPNETARVLDADGRYRTGDLARRDERGRLWIVGRIKDMLKAGGHRIAAREIEDVLVEHPAVHEAAVIGVSDETLGEQIKAFVVVDGDVDGQALAVFLSTRVPAYKIPKLWELVPDLPKNESGKVMKEVLRAR